MVHAQLTTSHRLKWEILHKCQVKSCDYNCENDILYVRIYVWWLTHTNCHYVENIEFLQIIYRSSIINVIIIYKQVYYCNQISKPLLFCTVHIIVTEYTSNLTK